MPDTEKTIETHAIRSWSKGPAGELNGSQTQSNNDGDEYDTPEFRAKLIAHFHQARVAAILEHAETPE